jgi:hypothetical protein
VAAREETLAAIEQFLATASRPVLIEAGEAEFPLDPGSYSLDSHGAFLYVSAWSTERTYRRRVLEVRKRQPGRIELTVARTGRPPGILTLFDSGYLRNDAVRLRGRRERFREEFRFMLRRQFAGWRLAELSSAPDLEHSLSPAYPRAALRQGTAGIAAIGAPPDSLNPDGVVTFGLIWLDYLRRRDPRVAYHSLAIFLDERHSRNTVLRLHWLDPSAAHFRLFAIDQGVERETDLDDRGNLDTRLGAPSSASPPPTPEGELESIVMRSVNSLDAMLQRNPVYRQAPAIAAGDRGIADLVAIDATARLAVLELKASQDIHLPLQALDYWIRVRWHAERGDFARLGYFPGREIASHAPSLYLVAPALEFHPSTETLLRFFEVNLRVIRLGLGANWRENLKVISRQERNEHSPATA